MQPVKIMRAAIALGLCACAAPATTGWGWTDGGRQMDAGPAGSGNPDAGGGGNPPPSSGGPVIDAAPPPAADASAPSHDAGKSPACVYPPGPYGITPGATVDPGLSWQGYLAGSSTISTLRSSDLLDCDKSKGINAIVLDESASWCAACQQEAQDLEPQMASAWTAEGVVVVTLMVEDDNSNPASVQTASAWKGAFGLTSVDVVADPPFTFGGQGSQALPTNLIVDPRTMRIVSVTPGYSGPDPAVDQLAQQNK